ncbi:hypothetical protein GALMADRAFT_1029005 [Galerina marginata CBS 339.88]|uniref:Uncharacterized protein n=1 Tax=Galerina marginata (strain CBS 339.88) TaxID=685588 RepID=A0A067SCU2_GALM3|nr:hypothetical protein GALMADRAFT_1029005 [Galerina marginata CBS 339.88]
MTCLDVYTRCLEFISRYPNKRKKKHVDNVKMTLHDHAPKILAYIWMLFESSKPIQNPFPLEPTWIHSVTKFLAGLFKLIDEPVDKISDWGSDESSGSTPEIMIHNLYFVTKIVHVSTHCLLFSDANSPLQQLLYTREMIYEADGLDAGSIAFEHYYEDARRQRWVIPQFSRLLDATMPDEVLCEIIENFIDFVAPHAEKSLCEKALFVSLAILGRLETTWTDAEHPKKKRKIVQSNKMLQLFFNIPNATGLNVLVKIVTKYQAAELMASALVIFANNFDREDRRKGSAQDKCRSLPVTLSYEMGMYQSF